MSSQYSDLHFVVISVIIAEKYSFPIKPANRMDFLPLLSLYDPIKKASSSGTTWLAIPFH